MAGNAESQLSNLLGPARQARRTIPIEGLRTLDDQLDRTLVNERLMAILASAFAALAVLLTVVGTYGVMSFVVSSRVRDIGVRLALGAPRGAAVWLVLRDAAVMAAAGLAIALPAAWRSAA